MPSEAEIEAAAKVVWAIENQVEWDALYAKEHRKNEVRDKAKAALTAAEGERHPHDSQVADLLRSLARQGRNGKVPDSGTLEYAEKMAKVITEREARTQGDPIKELGELQRERNEELRTRTAFLIEDALAEATDAD